MLPPAASAYRDVGARLYDRAPLTASMRAPAAEVVADAGGGDRRRR